MDEPIRPGFKMNTVYLLLILAVLFGALLLVEKFIRPVSEVERQMLRMAANLDAFRLAVGTILIPAIQDATTAMDDFARAFAAPTVDES